MDVGSPVVVALIAAGAAIAGSVITVLTARITAQPSTDEALTNRFTALIDRQTEEREHMAADYDRREAKLERVASDLEAMVIQFMAWADEVTIVAERRGVELPARPKFTHVDGRTR